MSSYIRLLLNTASAAPLQILSGGMEEELHRK